MAREMLTASLLPVVEEIVVLLTAGKEISMSSSDSTVALDLIREIRLG